MSRVNIKVLADQLQLSVSTISKALRDSYEISDETKKKVLELATRLNYVPNPYASSLRKKKSKTIAVVLPEVADNFFSLAINGIQSVAESKGYHVLIYLSHEKFANEKTILEDCQSGRVDGVLISISSETNTADHINKLQANNIPVVFFDREQEGIETARVTTNDFDCGFLAAKHLLQKGCRKPAFFSISQSLPICLNREKGFKTALRTAGIPEQDQQIIYCTDNDGLYKQVKTILQGNQRPDGLIASVEKIVTPVYLASYELNIRIPNDLKVIAFSTLDTAPILNPPLTTITQPAFEIGKAAATLLFKGIEKSSFDLTRERVIIPSVLIERQSTM
ncbi:LacI family transcriptional regulator [Niastella yeongjuensis]|uniref:LacI family transcriptional regulator n=1 Tax=Niastella yeongjuensis TaxID=354355 RepID=A0A1V9ENY0_9BACT|nr:LacI family DNA-binding transcriptional regulator [Niastella yeongjuensis]OQP47742.1 LacI family transcriptional regulator [Niastella yeongjuensis]SEP45572.1 transcriptional regulator, LacI family [Niastella yeongjuensis]